MRMAFMLEPPFRSLSLRGSGRQDALDYLTQWRMQKAGDLLRQEEESPDAIVAEALWFSLAPLRQEALHRVKNHVRQQQSEADSEIRTHLNAHLTSAEEKLLSELLELNRSEGLTRDQQAELQALYDR